MTVKEKKIVAILEIAKRKYERMGESIEVGLAYLESQLETLAEAFKGAQNEHKIEELKEVIRGQKERFESLKGLTEVLQDEAAVERMIADVCLSPKERWGEQIYKFFELVGLDPQEVLTGLTLAKDKDAYVESLIEELETRGGQE